MKKITFIIFSLLITYTTFGQKDYSINFHIYNNKGKLKNTIKYDLVKRGTGDFLIISTEGKFGIYNYKQGKVVTDLIYRDVGAIYKNGLALVKDKNEKWGLINLKNNNEIVLPFEYYKMFYLNDRYFTVTKFDRKWGIFDIVNKTFQ